VEEYLSERQQIDQVKAWIKENALWAVAGIVLGVGILVGMNQWRAWQGRQATEASAKYQQVLAALGRSDPTAAESLVKALQSDYSRTPYGDLGALALSRFEVESGKLEAAEGRLKGVLSGTRDADLGSVVRLRLARIQSARGEYADALATLAPGTGAAYDDLKGDVLAAKGDKTAAVAAWREALKDPTGRAVDHSLVELKIAAAGGEASSAAPAGGKS
jgi:predicted negative regulator of RcsB-dependent stress response